MERQRLRVFVSSPGDVAEERVLARDVVRRLAAEVSGSIDLHLYRWEDEPLLATAAVQHQIVEPKDFDLVVAIVWSRTGTPLPPEYVRADGSRYESGTVYEIEQALQSYRENGSPLLLMYRKTADVIINLRDEEEVLERVRQKTQLDAALQRIFVDHESGTVQGALHQFSSSAQFVALFEEHLRRLLAELSNKRGQVLSATRWDGSPFRGLRSFDVADAPIFFGRTDAIAAVLDAMRRQQATGCAFVLITGMSGCGKSSLARAGVLPVLTRWRSGVRYADVRLASARTPLDALAAALLDALPSLGTESSSAGDLAVRLRERPESVAGLVHDALPPLAAGERDGSAEFVVLVDTLEAIFTADGVTHGDRLRFVSALAALAEARRIAVVATMRSDFFARCEELPDLVRLKQGLGTCHLLPPSAAEIALIVQRPTQCAGLRFEQDRSSHVTLDEVLREDAATRSGSLPLLEFVLDELYERRRDDMLTFAAYEELGGIEGAVGRRAEEVFGQLSPRAQQSLPRVFGALVASPEVSETVAKRQVGETDLAAIPGASELIERLVEARLLVSDFDIARNERVISVAHEALFRHWPRLRGWIEENAEFLRTRARMEMSADTWEAESRNPDFLLAPGKPLAEALELLETRRDDLPERDVQFIRASAAAARRERQRKTRLISAVVASFVVVVTTLGGIGWFQRQQAVERSVALEKSELATRAGNIISSVRTSPTDNLAASILLSRDSLARFGTFLPSVVPALKIALDHAFERVVLAGHGSAVTGVAFAGDRIMTSSSDGTVAFWNTRGDMLSQSLAMTPETLSDVTAIAVDESAKLLVSGSAGGEMQFWTATGDLRKTVSAHPQRLTALAVSRDGQHIASASEDGSIRIWDRDGVSVAEITDAHPRGVHSLAFTRDGKGFLSGGADRKVARWSLAGKEIGSRDDIHRAPVTALATAPAADWIASADETGMLHVIKGGGAELSRLGIRAHAAAIRAIAISRAGLIATGGNDGVVRLWNGDGDLVGERFVPENGQITSVAFDAAGMAIAAAHAVEGAPQKTAVTLWDVDGGKPSNAARHLGTSTVAFSPSAAYIAIAGADGNQGSALRLLNTRGDVLTDLSSDADEGLITSVGFLNGGQTIVTTHGQGAMNARTLSGRTVANIPAAHEIGATAVAVAADGLVVSGGGDGTLTYWQLDLAAAPKWKRLRSVRAHEGAINHIAFDPSEQIIATCSSDGALALWTRDGKRKGPAHKSGDQVTTLAFSPDGKRIVTGGSDRVVQIRDLASGRVVRLTGHEGVVRTVAWSPDGQIIASGSEDRTVRFWMADGTPVGRPLKHDTAVAAVAFSPDGKTLIAGAAESQLAFWSGNPHSWLTAACGKLATVQNGGADGERLALRARARNACKSTELRPPANADLFAAIANRHRVDVERLARDASMLQQRNSLGWTPLLAAAFAGYDDLVEILLRAGADPAATDAQGETALTLAATSGSEGVLRALSRNRANGNIATQISSALLHAIRRRSAPAVKVLLEAGANVQAPRRGEFPYAVAEAMGDGTIMNLLLDAGAKPPKPLGRPITGPGSRIPSEFLPADLDSDVAEGLRLQWGEGVPAAPAKAVELYRRAALRGDAWGQFFLGRAYFFGVGVQQSYTEAHKWYGAAAKQGNSFALNSLASMYEDGNGVAVDAARAFELARASADRGNPWGLSRLASLYQEREEFETAANTYRQAADAGDEYAQQNYAALIETGTVPGDLATAFRYYSLAAAQGANASMAALGRLYEFGRGVPESRQQAIAWYERAAQGGSGDALLRLGWFYEHGIEVEASPATAIALYRKASELGWSQGAVRLGDIYRNGAGVPPSIEEAAKWYRVAAEGGNWRACYLLGWLYEHGQGVPKSAETALEWYRKAGIMEPRAFTRVQLLTFD